MANSKKTYSVKGTWVITEPLWGDSGKGKFSEFFGQQADMVVRYSGGDNAGHTVNLKNKEFKLHLVPGGVFNPKAISVLATSVVVNPISLAKEIQQLQAAGVKISAKNFLISEDAHMIMPWHQLRDGMSEKARGGKNIGTTGIGIGPTYSDRTSREGLRIKDLLDPQFPEIFKREALWQEKMLRLMDGELLVSAAAKKKTFMFQKAPHIDIKKTLKELKEVTQFLKPMIGNSFEIIQEYKAKGKKIVGEGAQGALLDIDLGSYPFVTSSHPGATGFSIATGINQKDIQKVIGIVKAYSTRVGGGPMPTELTDKNGTHLRTVGNEFGATTGRARRCGWLDTVAVQYGCIVAGIDSLILTKIDIMDQLKEVKLCVGYKVGSKTFRKMYTADPTWMEKAKPVYETFPGWLEDTSKVEKFADLPKNAKKYIQRIEEVIGLPIEVVSVGPAHHQTLIR
jgi:adenylosuccinate synthase